MNKLIVYIIFLGFFHHSFSQNLKREQNKLEKKQKSLTELLIIDAQLEDSLILQKQKINNLLEEYYESIKSGLENKKRIDSLNNENIRLKDIMALYKSEIDSLENLNRLLYIRLLYATYPTIKLPFIFHCQGSTFESEITTNQETDTLVFYGDSHSLIIGTHPDTSNFYSFFYLFMADDAIPSVVTFDKTGALIFQKKLAFSCYQGCESACRSIVTINNDLSIVFNYEEYLFECDDDEQNGSEFPDESFGFIEYSKIDINGNLIYLKKEKKTQAELLKNQITHPDEK